MPINRSILLNLNAKKIFQFGAGLLICISVLLLWNLNQGKAASSQYKALPLPDAPSLGSADAPVTIVIFGDYECPYCRLWEQEVFPQLIAAYGEDIRFVYLDLPLTSIHPQAYPAAQAAHCAGKQNQFWPYHKALFETESLGNETFFALAEDLSLDLPDFTNCLKQAPFTAQIEAGIQLAEELGFSGTPAFLVNGQPVIGAQPFEVFAQVIEGALK